MNSFHALLPLLAGVAGALVILLLEVFLEKERRDYLRYSSLVFLAAAAFLAVTSWGKEYSYFQRGLALDDLAVFLTLLFLLAVAFVILLSLKYIRQQDANHGEILGLL